MFSRFNIRFEQAARPKSDLYVDLLASLNSRRVDLLDNPKLISQLCALERRTARSGRDSVDHQPGGHDDVANAVAGVAAPLTTDRGAAYLEFCRRFNGSTDADRDGVEALATPTSRSATPNKTDLSCQLIAEQGPRDQVGAAPGIVQTK
jgi:hypothetical protein